MVRNLILSIFLSLALQVEGQQLFMAHNRPFGCTPEEVTVVLTSGTSWTSPADLDEELYVTISCIGGGGGGGSGSGLRGTAGGGGAGGCYARSTKFLSASTSYSYSIGGGGGSGQVGGPTWFNNSSYIYARGGDNGTNASISSGSGGDNSTLPSADIGDVTYLGGNGAAGAASGDFGGGGGGGADNITGNEADGPSGGAPSGTYGGLGGDGGSFDGQLSGFPGYVYGGAGGGGAYYGGSGGSGGSGGQGAIIITYWICDDTPPPSPCASYQDVTLISNINITTPCFTDPCNSYVTTGYMAATAYNGMYIAQAYASGCSYSSVTAYSCKASADQTTVTPYSTWCSTPYPPSTIYSDAACTLWPSDGYYGLVFTYGGVTYGVMVHLTNGVVDVWDAGGLN